MDATIVSAPGKVLLAGGYLVLDPKYSGLVVSTSSRFYTVVQQGNSGNSNAIHVRSPQFKSAIWDYSVNIESHVEVTQSTEAGSRNKFVHVALQCALQLALEAKGPQHMHAVLANGLDVTIVGDNDFYSQRAKLAELGLPSVISSLSKIEPFAYTGIPIGDVHKTGLGSSAALITSLVASLLVHLSVIPASSLDGQTGNGRILAHNAAQFVHCLAQGKIGSGFDVASAVFGSQIYTRFDPAVLEPIMGEHSSAGPFLEILSPTTGNNGWNYRVVPFQLPPLTRLMLADVDAGSDTPSLVGKVLKWRKAEGSEADAFWDLLADSNNALAKTLMHISELQVDDPSIYSACVGRLSKLQSSQWLAASGTNPGDQQVVQSFYDAHCYSEIIRVKMREMGERSGVPIEPPEQTELLDACISQAGVLGGGVPGAGGYDAIWLLVLNPGLAADDTASDRVQSVWTSWKKLDVSPLSATESFEKGLRLEKMVDIPGLWEAMKRE